MAELRDAILAKKKREAQFALETVAYSGKIVARNGSVNVPGLYDHVWVMPYGEGEPEAVYNRRVRAKAGVWVWVGYATGSTILEVLGVDVTTSAGNESTAYLELIKHAFTHRRFGDDPVWIERRMNIDGLHVSPAGGLNVRVSPYEYYYQGQRVQFGGLSSLAVSLPTAGQQYYALIYLNRATNSISVLYGSTTAYVPAVKPTKPAAPVNSIPAAYVLLHSQTNVQELDIDDARLEWSGVDRARFNDAEGEPEAVGPTTADGTSEHAARRDHVHNIDITAFTEETTADDTDVLLIYDAGAGANRKMTRANLLDGIGGGAYPPDGVVKIDETEYATLVAAEAATAAGDMVKVGPGTYTELVQITNAITLRGASRERTIIHQASPGQALQVQAAAVIEDLRVTETWGVVVAAGGAGAVLRNVESLATAAILNQVAFELQGSCLLDRCYGTATGGTSTNRCIRANASGITVTIRGGAYTGTEALYVVSGATVVLEGPTLTGTINNSGTVSGWYIDGSTGNVVIVGALKLLGSGSNAPDIGSTTAAEQFGNIYLASGKDIYADSDEAGLMFRASGLRTVTDRLNSLPALTWATYATYFVTPTAAATIPSQVSAFYNGGTANQTRSFGYLGSYNNGFGAFCLAGIANCRTGIRMDDGSMTNYIELFLEMQSSGLVKLRYRRSDDGTETGPTDLWGGGASMPAMRYWLNLARVGNTVYMYAGAEGQYIPVVGSYAFSSWTPTRRGLFHEHPNGGTTDLQYASKWDDLSYT